MFSIENKFSWNQVSVVPSGIKVYFHEIKITDSQVRIQVVDGLLTLITGNLTHPLFKCKAPAHVHHYLKDIHSGVPKLLQVV